MTLGYIQYSATLRSLELTSALSKMIKTKISYGQRVSLADKMNRTPSLNSERYEVMPRKQLLIGYHASLFPDKLSLSSN